MDRKEYMEHNRLYPQKTPIQEGVGAGVNMREGVFPCATPAGGFGRKQHS